MSISRSAQADRVTSGEWQDLVEQEFRIAYQVSDSFLDGGEQAAGPHTAEVDPVEGLHRDEEAELVALVQWFHWISIESQSGEGSTPGDYRGEFELSINEGVGSPDDDALNDTESNLQVPGYRHGNVFNRLWRSDAVGLSPFNDTTNGTGGGGQSGWNGFEVLPYRDLFGQGPIVDSRDTLFTAAHIASHENDNENLEMEVGVSLFWDVYEVPD